MASMEKQHLYEHLDQAKRDRIQPLWEVGHTQQQIADVLGITQPTISRELKRNGRKRKIRKHWIPDRYDASYAQWKARLRRKDAKYQGMKINQDNRLERYITSRLKKGWNPDEISGRMKKDHKPYYASKTAIYQWLHTGWGGKYVKYLYTKRSSIKRQNPNKAKRVLIPHRISITERPLGATNRSRFGHWEADTAVSGKQSGSKAALSVAYERKAKFIEARRIPNMRPRSHNHALKDMLKHKKALSLTQDNGIENTKHIELGIPTFFCDPYSSWQKGGVENAIRMIRRYIPKRSDIGMYSDAYVSMVVHRLNSKPRKSLGYLTPYEIMEANGVMESRGKTPNQKYALEG